jgi:hypothetical protein
VNVQTVVRALAEHDAAEPLRSPTGNYGLRCRCGVECWSTDDTVLEMHRVHVAAWIVKATSADVERSARPSSLVDDSLGVVLGAVPAMQCLGGCNCWDKAPTIPTCRSRDEHLDDCPAKGSDFPVGVLA